MKIETIIRKLEKHRLKEIDADRGPSDEEVRFFNGRVRCSGTAIMYVPHTENYEAMLGQLRSKDVVCDMGAGDLRFALLASMKCQKVYAIELNPCTIGNALTTIGYNMPHNLIVMCGDWNDIIIPRDTTVITVMVNGAEIPKWWKKAGRRIYVGTTGNNGGKIERLKL